jgi:hypothetical protein
MSIGPFQHNAFQPAAFQELVGVQFVLVGGPFYIDALGSRSFAAAVPRRNLSASTGTRNFTAAYVPPKR